MGALKELKENIYESIKIKPCKESELFKRDFLRNISKYGIDLALNELIREGKVFEKELDDDYFYSAFNSDLDIEDIKKGHLYKSKRRTKVFLDSGICVYNDRRVLALWANQVHYDSPSIKTGENTISIDISDFMNWVKADVTNESPDKQWVEVYQ